MRVAIFETANYSNDYNKSNSAYRKCYGREVEPCLNRFRPRPVVLYKKIICRNRLYNKGRIKSRETRNFGLRMLDSKEMDKCGRLVNTTYQIM